MANGTLAAWKADLAAEACVRGLIFGSAHPRGMDKFLQVAWKKDEVNGEANFDIGRDNVMPDQPKLDFEIFAPTKLIVFERELEMGLRGGAFRDELDVIRACFRHGVRRQHATAVLSRLKREPSNWTFAFRISTGVAPHDQFGSCDSVRGTTGNALVIWLLATYKYLLSFRKAEWTLDDYPVRLRRQATSAETPAVRAWCAQIVNWWMLSGFGDTPEGALEDLRELLEAKRARGALPRPGTKPPIELAPGNELSRHGEFAYEFVERVVGIRPFFMSDQTSLADFCTSEEAPDVHRKTALLYGIDTRAMFDDPLWKVLDLVQENDIAD